MDQERVVHWIGRVLIAAGLVLLCLPQGLIGRQAQKVLSDLERRYRVSSSWSDLVSLGTPLNPGATPQVLYFGDYHCPFCRAYHPSMLHSMRSDDRVGMVYVHLPTAVDTLAMAAARAATCAARQGRFQAMHARLYESTGWLDAQWSREAALAGVPDAVAFRSCLTSDRTRDEIAAQVKMAEELGVTGTPAFVTRSGKLLLGRSGAAELGAMWTSLGSALGSS